MKKEKSTAKAAKKVKLPYSGKELLLSVQHLFAMFGATILVPLLTGFNPSTALFTAGIGTLIFHLMTKCKVPVFLGSSFAFIPALAAVVGSEGVTYAQGGIIVAGLIYCVLSVIVYFVGADRVRKLLPPAVTGPIIIVIAMSLAKVAVTDAFYNSGATFDPISLAIAAVTMIVIVIGMIFARGFFKIVPILIGLICGYALSAILGACGVFEMNYTAIANAEWINIPYYTEGFIQLPQFSGSAILAIAPIALVSFMEHIGDITTNGMVVGKDFFKDPGLHRTVLGDGMATLVAGFFGGPPNTTYSENTGVLATTKNYNPKLLRLTAVFAIVLGLFGKFGAVLQTIPNPVKGGVEIILFGTIAAVGIRTLAESKLDFTNSRNLIVVGTILVLGIGLSVLGGIPITSTLTLSGLFIATIVGVLLNLILPKRLEKEDAKEGENIQRDFKEFDIFAVIANFFKKIFGKSNKKKANCDTIKVEDMVEHNELDSQNISADSTNQDPIAENVNEDNTTQNEDKNNEQ